MDLDWTIPAKENPTSASLTSSSGWVVELGDTNDEKGDLDDDDELDGEFVHRGPIPL